MTEDQDRRTRARGPIRYRDGGEGEPIVFVHGFLVDGRLWDGVAERLSGEFRCIQPDWPMGSHVGRDEARCRPLASRDGEA